MAFYPMRYGSFSVCSIHPYNPPEVNSRVDGGGGVVLEPQHELDRAVPVEDAGHVAGEGDGAARDHAHVVHGL